MNYHMPQILALLHVSPPSAIDLAPSIAAIGKQMHMSTTDMSIACDRRMTVKAHVNGLALFKKN